MPVSNAEPGAAQLAGTGNSNADVSVAGNRRPTTSAEIATHKHEWTEHPPATIGGQSVWTCDCGLYSIGGDLALYPVGEVAAAIYDHQQTTTSTRSVPPERRNR